MARIVQIGGSVVGLAAALLLARDGHSVTVLERDAAPPPPDPEAAWSGWRRPGVPQFHQAHNLFPGFRRALEEDLPEVMDALEAAGCVWVDPFAQLPPTLVGQPRVAGDDRFRFLTGRRPVTEWTLAGIAHRHEGLEIRRGVEVEGLLTGRSGVDGVPHVVGVRTTSGEELRADLVVDAGGRRSKLGRWLSDVGAEGPEVTGVDHGFVYHTRYFRGTSLPAQFAAPVTEFASFSILTLPGDNDTWSLTIWRSASDPALKKLSDAETWMRLAGALPLHAHWLDGEAITDVLTGGGILDRLRRFVVDGRPVATGVAAVGDSWACTNPSAGRGMSVGIIHAQVLRDCVRDHLDDPAAFARAFDEETARRVGPWFWAQLASDERRIAEMRAVEEGREPEPRDELDVQIGVATSLDLDVFRGVLEYSMCLDHRDAVLARPGFLDRVRLAAAGHDPRPPPGPSRRELIDLLR